MYKIARIDDPVTDSSEEVLTRNNIICVQGYNSIKDTLLAIRNGSVIFVKTTLEQYVEEYPDNIITILVRFDSYEHFTKKYPEYLL